MELNCKVCKKDIPSDVFDSHSEICAAERDFLRSANLSFEETRKPLNTLIAITMEALMKRFDSLDHRTPKDIKRDAARESNK